MTIASIIALAQALAPLVAPLTVTVEQIIGALKGAGVLSDDQITADLQALIIDALAAKAEADLAASGNDPQ